MNNNRMPKGYLKGGEESNLQVGILQVFPFWNLPSLKNFHLRSEVIELDLHDLEGIGLSRLQVRRLQALASSRLEDAPPPPPPGPPPGPPPPGPSPPPRRARSRSPEWQMDAPPTVRQRSASSKRTVRFRSVSSVSWLRGIHEGGWMVMVGDEW